MPLWIKNFAGWVYVHPWLSIGTALVLTAVVYFSFCSGSSTKIDEDNANINQGKGAANVITNEISNVNGQISNQANEVNGKSGNTNQAGNDLGNSVNRPSNSFDGNGAGNRFCRDFPNDPSCR